MGLEERDIKIISVDKNAIKESSEQAGSWILPFKLSKIPEDFWSRNFYEVHKKNPVESRRKANVVEDFIMVGITATDDLQRVLDALKIDVVNTNAICEVNYQKKLQLQQELEILKKKQAETLLKFKSDSDNLKF